MLQAILDIFHGTPIAPKVTEERDERTQNNKPTSKAFLHVENFEFRLVAEFLDFPELGACASLNKSSATAIKEPWIWDFKLTWIQSCIPPKASPLGEKIKKLQPGEGSREVCRTVLEEAEDQRTLASIKKNLRRNLHRYFFALSDYTFPIYLLGYFFLQMTPGPAINALAFKAFDLGADCAYKFLNPYAEQRPSSSGPISEDLLGAADFTTSTVSWCYNFVKSSNSFLLQSLIRLDLVFFAIVMVTYILPTLTFYTSTTLAERTQRTELGRRILRQWHRNHIYPC